MTLGPGALALLLATLCFLPPGDDEVNLDELREQIATEVRAGEWSAASKSIRLLKKHGKSAVKEEVKSLDEWRKARKQLLALDEKWRKNKLTLEAALPRFEAFLQQHRKQPYLQEELIQKFTQFIESAFVLIEDFESYPLGHQQERMSVVNSPRHWGSQAARWTDERMSDEKWSVFSQTSDWTEFEALVLWIHAEKPGQVFEVRVWLKDGKGAKAPVQVRWKGWKQVRLPLRGKRAPFRIDPGGDWSQVNSIQFYKDEGIKVDVTIDDLYLEKSRAIAK